MSGVPLPWLFPLGLLLALALQAFASDTALLATLAVGVAVLGLPHGSLDPEIARQRFQLRGAGAWTGFLLLYGALAAAVLGVWWLWPVTALTAFLLYSAWHFGEDTGGRLGGLAALGYGLLVVFLPLALQPDASGVILQQLAGRRPEALLANAPAIAAGGGLLWAQGLLRHRRRSTPSDVADPLLLLGGAWLLPPLAYFIAYFCFLHSPRHLLETAAALGLADWRARLQAVVPTTLATWALAALALPWLLAAPPEQAVLQLVFIGLAALTVPHMLLDAARRR